LLNSLKIYNVWGKKRVLKLLYGVCFRPLEKAFAFYKNKTYICTQKFKAISTLQIMTHIRKILLHQKDKFLFAFLFALFLSASFAEGSSFTFNDIFPSHPKQAIAKIHISSSVNAPIEDFVFEEYEEDDNFSLFRLILKNFSYKTRSEGETHISNHAFEHFSLVVHPPLYDLFCNWKSFLIA